MSFPFREPFLQRGRNEEFPESPWGFLGNGPRTIVPPNETENPRNSRYRKLSPNFPYGDKRNGNWTGKRSLCARPGRPGAFLFLVAGKIRGKF